MIDGWHSEAENQGEPIKLIVAKHSNSLKEPIKWILTEYSKINVARYFQRYVKRRKCVENKVGKGGKVGNVNRKKGYM